MTHVIITGGSSGIGLALAALYAGRGARLSLIARSRDLLELAAQKLVAKHGAQAADIHIETADVANEAEIGAAIGHCVEALGPCDILVTSAGIVEPAPFLDASSDAFRRQMDTNFSGTVNAVRAVYPDMARRRRGHIVMISSGSGLIGIYGYTAYCASKFALRGFAEALRSEGRCHGVDISVGFPPDTETPQFEREIAERPPEASVVMGVVRPWSAEAVARKIGNGVAKKRFEIYFGLTLFLLGRFGPAVRPLIDWWFDRAIARSRGR
ncbi:SDR family oxidoreductase [Sinorhizobium americanum]|uniref:3-dehydrosphinganine reductase n=1 Tax=Sinorhizobium americanum TaxID=194963 RepID=A0A1L3LIM3_9HYPH|nr:SDR family oxidoreductase [Sinorhizobium americanum]APG83358.1 short-chain dehydrogenase/reductase RkpH [Sinorhizobium americanum CCGM7]APG89895.1 short-chain dehydrogenase/reductase RkpH [Sinorhizobium americanum]OAP47197.1 translocation protein [Sinorhizobium americanum]TCN36363.1 short-subunit dehydrogenase [Sinorhizobium americanum]